MKVYQDNFITVAEPKPTDAMFYGFVGELAHKAVNGTGLNPVAVATVFLSFLGANVGRYPFLMVGDTIHHPRLFTLHIGRSGVGGKSSSQGPVHRIRNHIGLTHSGLLGQTYSCGLSSLKELVALIDGNNEDKAISDKRLWVLERELPDLLHQGRRDGGLLATALREAWDGSDIQPVTKGGAQLHCDSPHIGIHAGITPAELKQSVHLREGGAGFFKRFLMVFSENISLEAFPEPTPETVIEDLASKTADIIRFAKGGYPASLNGMEMHLSEAARGFYEGIYPGLMEPFDSDTINDLLSRCAPYLLRLAMLFALSDQSRIIEPCHLKAASAWVDYAVATVKYVFPDQSVSPQARETRTHADKILAFLGKHPEGAGLRELNNDCFKRNLSSDKIQKALGCLLAENPPPIEQVDIPTKGRTAKVYLLNNCHGQVTEKALQKNL